MAGPITVDWDELGFSEVRPDVFGATIRSAQLTATLYRYAAGSAWEAHDHPEDQITVVLSGEIVFESAGVELRLGPGRTALIPGGVPHSARVGAEEAVTLNVWPPRAADAP